MDYLFILINLFIIYHAGLVVVGLLPYWQQRHAQISMGLAVGLVALMGIAIGKGSWEMTCIVYAAYRLWILMDLLKASAQKRSPISPLVWVDALMLSGALLAVGTQIWSIFLGAYAICWILTLIFGRKLMHKHISP